MVRITGGYSKQMYRIHPHTHMYSTYPPYAPPEMLLKYQIKGRTWVSSVSE